MKLVSGLIGVFGILLSVFGVDYGKDVWRARSQGADFNVLLKVVDDEGRPVADAKCSGWMYMESGKGHGSGYSSHTDSQGCVRIAGRCSEWFSVVIRKDGYYRTMFEVKYPDKKENTAIVDGKWQPYGETRTVVLKKIKNPRPLNTVMNKYSAIPVFGEWIGFDLFKTDWVKPYGGGEESDVLLRFVTHCDNDPILRRTMEVSFTNSPFAGAYFMKRESFSEFDTEYQVNTNVCFKGSFLYEFNHTESDIVRDELQEDQCLVFRVRTKVDGKGVLKSAHYGVLFGNWRFFECNRMCIGKIRFNPTPNDTNLEDAETARKSRLRYKQSLEFEKRRKKLGM